MAIRVLYYLLADSLHSSLVNMDQYPQGYWQKCQRSLPEKGFYTLNSGLIRL